MINMLVGLRDWVDARLPIVRCVGISGRATTVMSVPAIGIRPWTAQSAGAIGISHWNVPVVSIIGWIMAMIAPPVPATGMPQPSAPHVRVILILLRIVRSVKTRGRTTTTTAQRVPVTGIRHQIVQAAWATGTKQTTVRFAAICGRTTLTTAAPVRNCGTSAMTAPHAWEIEMPKPPAPRVYPVGTETAVMSVDSTLTLSRWHFRRTEPRGQRRFPILQRG